MSIRTLLEKSLRVLVAEGTASDKDLETYELLNNSLTELESLRKFFGDEKELSGALKRLSVDFERLSAQVQNSQSQISSLAAQLQEERKTTQSLTELLTSLAEHLQSFESFPNAEAKTPEPAKTTTPRAVDDDSAEAVNAEVILRALTEPLSTLDKATQSQVLEFFLSKLDGTPDVLRAPQYFGALDAREKQSARLLSDALRMARGDSAEARSARLLAEKIEAIL